MELIGRYSRYGPDLDKLNRAAALDEAKRPREGEQPADAWAVKRRLTPQEIDELVDAYRVGQSAPSLAAMYGISRTSVLNLIDAAGGDRHARRMSDAETAEAIRLYESGLSLVSTGDRLGRAGSVIYGVL